MAAHPDGTPCWADAMLNDLEAGKRFYGGLLGWTFGESEESYGQYTQAYGPDGKNVAALSPKPDGRMPTVWNLYFASSDIRATADRIRDAGGQLIMDPMTVGPFGTMLMAADPGGAVFGVWQAGTHGGFEATGVPGSYVWAEVYTRETEPPTPSTSRSSVWPASGSTTRPSTTGSSSRRARRSRPTTPCSAASGWGRASPRNCPRISSSTSPSPTAIVPRRRSLGSGDGSRGSDGFAFRPFAPGE